MEPNPHQVNTAPPRARWIKVMPAAVTLMTFIAAGSADYVVQSGDTLNRIASELGVSKAELISANSIPNPDLIRVGQVLVIPGSTPAVTGTTHTVSAGETLAGIARQYGADLGSLVSANALTNPNLIRIGQQLLISSGTPPAPVAAAPVAAAPVATPPVAAPPPAATVATHTVAPGDTLASIAHRHGTTVEVIATANGITDPSIIYIGTVLQVAASPVVPAPEAVASAPVHTVAAGESLAGVAAQYGTTVDAIVTTNGIPDPNLISVGQVLQVQPGVSAWTCPVAGAHYFNDWGFPRSGGRFHTGNDLFAPTGTPVVSPVSGTIDFLEGPVGGLQFRLYGDDGVTYIGSHLDTLLGTDGYITAGSQLGTVGSTGNAAGSRPHLHFETKPADGPAVNPYPTLQSNGC